MFTATKALNTAHSEHAVSTGSKFKRCFGERIHPRRCLLCDRGLYVEANKHRHFKLYCTVYGVNRYDGRCGSRPLVVVRMSPRFVTKQHDAPQRTALSTRNGFGRLVGVISRDISSGRGGLSHRSVESGLEAAGTVFSVLLQLPHR